MCLDLLHSGDMEQKAAWVVWWGPKKEDVSPPLNNRVCSGWEVCCGRSPGGLELLSHWPIWAFSSNTCCVKCRLAEMRQQSLKRLVGWGTRAGKEAVLCV